jgi:hypothetical protein
VQKVHYCCIWLNNPCDETYSIGLNCRNALFLRLRFTPLKYTQCLGGKHVPDYEIKFAFWNGYRRKCGAFNEGNVQGPLQTKA